jgi:hypothetical protein
MEVFKDRVTRVTRVTLSYRKSNAINALKWTPATFLVAVFMAIRGTSRGA